MRQVMKQLPHESIIYLGDTARVPYGEKSKETIIRYSIENSIFLMDKSIKLLVVACNTASAYSLEKLRKIFNIPVLGVIEPGAKRAAAVTKNQRIAILGTKGTISSGCYQAEIKKLIPQAELFPLACPLFVPLVEEGFFRHSAAELVVKEYLKPLKDKAIDTLLLGCTHYPFLKDLIQAEVGRQVTIIDSASTCAEEIQHTLAAQQQLAHKIGQPSYEYFVSDDPERFKKNGELFLGQPIPYVSATLPMNFEF